MEDMVDRTFWQDHPTFMTGGTGLVGLWLTQWLVDASADVVCLICDCDVLERTLGDYKADTFVHLAVQTFVTIQTATRSQPLRLTSQAHGI